ncbi:hypothetical protein ACFPJ1_40820 [Kribbella qitaiheensis]|uniref:hypothetical protein n=1 Tax=Kribbella qitaiheensis TaxID=1544730 RepID=UPI00361D3D5B
MARQQKLKLTLRNIGNGREWTNQPLTITADPEDHAAIKPRIEQMARDLDGRGSGVAWWADQYKVHVEGIKEHWWDFWVPGGEG